MGAPSATKELDELVDGLFDLAIRIKQARTPDSPGGTSLTVTEILHSIGDDAADLRDSIQDVHDTIRRLSTGEGSPVDLVIAVAHAVIDLATTLRSALDDGRVTADEIMAGVTNGHIRESLARAIEGAGNIGAETQNLDFMRTMWLVQRVMTKLPLLAR